MVTCTDSLVAGRVSMTTAIFLAIGAGPAELAFTLVIRRAGTAAVNAFFKASALAKRFPVADVALLAGAQIRARSVETGGIRVTVVLTQSAFVYVRALCVSPAPNGLTRIVGSYGG